MYYARSVFFSSPNLKLGIPLSISVVSIDDAETIGVISLSLANNDHYALHFRIIFEI
jgi:hypothetical protein